MNINNELNSKILAILKLSKRPFRLILNDKQLMEYINSNVPLLVKNGNSIQTKLYWLFNEITEFPTCQNVKCENYGKPIKKDVYSWQNGYSAVNDPHIHCNNKCAQLDKTTISHVKKTKLHNHGDENFNNREKAECTCLNKYGVTHTSKLKDNREKMAQTKFKNHGYRNYVNVEKAQQTYFDKTGYLSPSQNPDVQLKSQQTNIKHRGVPFPGQSEEVKNKAKATLLKNYGVTSSFKIPGLREKAMREYFQRTGYENPMLNPEVQKKFKKHYTYNNINFDSSWELAVYIFYKDHNINVEYMPDIRFKYFDPISNLYKWYLPDFKINDQLVEIKGDQFFNENGQMQNPFDHSQDIRYEAKHQCMIENNIKILRRADIKKYIDYIEQKYGKHYLKQFKRK